MKITETPWAPLYNFLFWIFALVASFFTLILIFDLFFYIIKKILILNIFSKKTEYIYDDDNKYMDHGDKTRIDILYDINFITK